VATAVRRVCRPVSGARQGLRSGDSMGEALHAAVAVTREACRGSAPGMERKQRLAWLCLGHDSRREAAGEGLCSTFTGTSPSAAAAAGCLLACGAAKQCIA
jgi:hypothetical protein